MNRTFRISFLALVVCLLPACTADAQAPAPQLILAMSTATPVTPTIVWFPPSITPSPRAFPSQAPTPERKPGVGAVLFTDDFSSGKPWNPAISDEAGVDVSGNRLTIAAQPKVNTYRLRDGESFNNFYAEITAWPSLCRGQDDYGLAFRAPNRVAYYSFVLSCDGMASVERVSVGTAHILQPPIPSADVPAGAPGEVRLGVWAVGPEMRFFLNGRYQFSVTDPSYTTGSVGAFVRSAGDTPVTVSFSDLTVYDVNYAPSTATPAARATATRKP